MESGPLILGHIEVIQQNSETTWKHFPKTAECAQAINQAMDSLLRNHIKPDHENVSQCLATMMTIGAFSSWVDACLLASAGRISSAFSSIRRGIEYTCYLAKAGKSKEVALAWISQVTDQDARRTFSVKCSIPLAYEAEKYRVLRPLIVCWETATNYGSHGNVEAQWHNFKRIEANEIMFTFECDAKTAAMTTGFMIMCGYRILQAVVQWTRPWTANAQHVEPILENVTLAVKEARLELASANFHGVIPEKAVQSIIEDLIDETPFQKMIEAAKRKKEINPTRIQTLAYRLWEIKGRGDGHALEDWVEAESLLSW